MNNRISVVLPVYNEEKAIAQVLDEIIKVMKEGGYNFEIIVVDDCSTDRTFEIARMKNVKVIRHAVNKGSGASRKTGILNAEGDIVVMLDADGTYPVKSIPELLKYFPEYDQVIGARNKEQGTLRIIRQPTKWLLFRLASYLAKTEIPDLNSGLRAFRRDIALKYLYLVPNGFSCVSTITLMFICNGYSVKFIPIEYYKRIGKSKFKAFIGTRDLLFTIIRITMHFNPLRIFLPLSSLLFAFGIIKTVFDVWFSSVKRMQSSDIVIIIGAINILVLGLLADLIVTQRKRDA